MSNAMVWVAAGVGRGWAGVTLVTAALVLLAWRRADRSGMGAALVTGVLIGVVIGVVFLPLAWVAWGSGPVAVAVSLALFASCAVATLVAMGLPFLLQRLGRDPAFGSGPLATVVQDLLSLAIYFAVAVPVVL